MNNMIKVTLMITLMGFSIGTVQASSNSSNNELADSLIWEITGPDITEPSYLAGTMHIMCEKDFSIDERFTENMKKTKQLYLEVDLDDPKQIAVLEKSIFVDTPLKDRLSTIQYNQLTDLIELQTKFNINMFDKMSFLGIQSMMFYGMMDCPIKGLDEELKLIAQAKQMPVYGLETAQDQINAFELMSPKMSENAWTDVELETMFGGTESLKKMQQLYAEQNISGLYNMVVEQFSNSFDSDAAQHAMLTDRNTQWAQKIPQLIKSDPTFFAVGTAHLAGENGVINLLRQAGLTVKPIMK